MPAATGVSVLPLTVHIVGVVEAKLTVRPESAVADKVAGVPTDCVPGDANVMVWLGNTTPLADATVKVLLTVGAAL